MAQAIDRFQQALLLLQEQADPLWPDFAPAHTPFLVFDGSHSWLVHADPPVPAGWQHGEGHWRFPGRHPQVLANTATVLDHLLPTATILLSELPDGLTSHQLAALAVHEAFHVYQAQHPSPAWNADESSGLTYPVEDEQVLLTRAMETRALHQAVQMEDEGQDWAAIALGWRQRREALLSAEHRAYERSLELVEGLAHYVELRFLNEAPQLEQPDVPAEQIRHRTYAVGAAYALLLDRWKTNWRAVVQEDGVPLDVLLASVLVPVEDQAAVPEDVRGWVREQAQGVKRRQEEALASFDARPGGRLTLTVADGGEPMWLQGFDPLNLRRLADGSLLHTRFLRFENSTLTGEVLGSICRTWGAGPHPFTSGFNRIDLVDVVWTEGKAGLQATGAGVSVQSSKGRLQGPPGPWRWEMGETGP